MITWHISFPIVAAMIWAGSPVAAKLSVDVIDPIHIAFLRWLIALVILTPFILPTLPADKRLLIRNLPQLALLGLLGMVVYQSLAYFAVRFTTVGNIGILDVTIPIFVTLIEMIVLRRPQPFRVLVGCAIAALGIVVLMFQEHGTKYDLIKFNIGDGLMLLSCLAYAIYSVLISRIALTVNRWHSLYFQIFAAVLILSPFYVFSAPTLPGPRGLPILLYVGVLSSILAPYAWMQGIRYIGSARTTIFLNLVPVMTLAIAVIMLGEPLTSAEVVGGSLSLFGVILSQSST